jgi:hypothetical protein
MYKRLETKALISCTDAEKVANGVPLNQNIKAHHVKLG